MRSAWGQYTWVSYGSDSALSRHISGRWYDNWNVFKDHVTNDLTDLDSDLNELHRLVSRLEDMLRQTNAMLGKVA